MEKRRTNRQWEKRKQTWTNCWVNPWTTFLYSALDFGSGWISIFQVIRCCPFISPGPGVVGTRETLNLASPAEVSIVKSVGPTFEPEGGGCDSTVRERTLVSVDPFALVVVEEVDEGIRNPVLRPPPSLWLPWEDVVFPFFFFLFLSLPFLFIPFEDIVSFPN